MAKNSFYITHTLWGCVNRKRALLPASQVLVNLKTLPYISLNMAIALNWELWKSESVKKATLLFGEPNGRPPKENDAHCKFSVTSQLLWLKKRRRRDV